MELLSPAGSREAMTAAVQNGADAVYLGGSAFNARRSASNFDDTAMQETLDYCHERGVAVHVTLNTLLFDRELDAAVKFAAFLCRAGADAVIVQDIGLFSLLHSELPELPLHASTQMGIHTIEGARHAKKLGASRVVLARETSLDNIKRIRGAVDVEIEAFAHGALCMSFSGACLLSSMAGERSGNRGTCAQPCRKRISVCGAPAQNDYALSPADLCMIEHIADMRRAGVDSIKLEGRMKRPEYVAVVTRAYRLALDGAPMSEILSQKQRMLELFDRGGGSTGYCYGDGVHTGCVAKSEPGKALLTEAAESYRKETRKRAAKLTLTMRVGEPAKMTIHAGEKHVEVTGDVPERANKPQEAHRYAAQAEKLGDTPFEGRCETFIDADAFLPMSEVNAMRREACDALAAQFHVRRNCIEPCVALNKPVKACETLITAAVLTTAQAEAAFSAGADEVALEPNEYTMTLFEGLQHRREQGKLLMSLPAVIMDAKEAEKIKQIADSGLVDGAIAANIGQLELIGGLPLKIAGAQMNAMNRATVEKYKAMGFDRVTLSMELTKPQLADVAGDATSIFAYGRAQLMQLRHCPIKERLGCQRCRGIAGSMTDEAGRKFPLCNVRQEDGCIVRLLNCVPTDVLAQLGEIPKTSAVQLSFYDETPGTVTERVRAAKLAIAGEKVEPSADSTRGHWARPVD